MLRPSSAAALVALALGSLHAGCRTPAPVAPTPAPLCVVRAGLRTPAAVALHPEDWFGLLQCDLIHARPDPRYTDCEEPLTDWTPLPPQPMTAADVVVSILSRRERLVWLIWRRTAAGEGIGPVVLADVDGPRAEVRAIGTLRARAVNPHLRLRRVGDVTVLSAEGDRCVTDSPASCQPWVRLMVKVGDRFTETPLVRERGQCVSEAYFPLADESVAGVEGGWLRRFSLTRTLRYDTGALTLHEQVVVSDQDPRAAGTLPRPFRTVEADRAIAARGERLVVDRSSLWSRVRAEEASVSDADAAVAVGVTIPTH